MALREQLRDTLDDLVKMEVLVTRPTDWVNYMVALPKNDGTMRVCIDPKKLNKFKQQEHYQFPMIEEIATRLHGAKHFSVLDVQHGFCHG